MKKIIKELEKQLEKLIEHIQSREDKYLERSEKWQESEKGEEYDDLTCEIQTQSEELDIIISELKELA